MRNPSPLTHLVAKQSPGLSKALAQGIRNTEGLEETEVEGTRWGTPVQSVGSLFTQGPPGGSFGAYVNTGPGVQAARTFVDRLESGPFALMVPQQGDSA